MTQLHGDCFPYKRWGSFVVMTLICTTVLLGCARSVHDEAAAGNLEAVEAMIAEDPNLVNEPGFKDMTPLHYAASRGRAEVAGFLIEHGADLDARNSTGLTPLHGAAWWNRTNVAEILLEAGADIEARDHFGDTPLHTAATQGRVPVINLLAQHGADIEARNDEGLTPRELAVRHRNDQAVSRLDELLAAQ